jgi:hypothetical protein
MRMLLALLGTAALVASGAACGSSEGTEPNAYTAQEVIQAFQGQAGRPLLRKAAGGDEAWEQLGLGLNPSRELLSRFGTFSIYVVEPGNDEAVQSLLTDKATGKPLAAGGGGVFWENDTHSGAWVAYKRYGANVVLAWWRFAGGPETDARFQRLHGVLRRLDLS